MRARQGGRAKVKRIVKKVLSQSKDSIQAMRYRLHLTIDERLPDSVHSCPFHLHEFYRTGKNCSPAYPFLKRRGPIETQKKQI